MITYFPNATPEEQLNLWYNGNEDEVVLAKYLKVVYQGYCDNEDSQFNTGYDVGYESGFDAGYVSGLDNDE